MLDLLVELKRDLGFEPAHLGAGGGLGIAYTRSDDPPTPREFVDTLRGTLTAGTARRDLRTPRLVVEPGRSIAGPAGVTPFKWGSSNDNPGGRRDDQLSLGDVRGRHVRISLDSTTRWHRSGRCHGCVHRRAACPRDAHRHGGLAPMAAGAPHRQPGRPRDVP